MNDSELRCGCRRLLVSWASGSRESSCGDLRRYCGITTMTFLISLFCWVCFMITFYVCIYLVVPWVEVTVFIVLLNCITLCRNERVSNHRCLALKKISKLCATSHCEGNPLTGRFPSQTASNAESVSIWWRHHGRYVPWTLVYHPVTWSIWSHPQGSHEQHPSKWTTTMGLQKVQILTAFGDFNNNWPSYTLKGIFIMYHKICWTSVSRTRTERALRVSLC